MKSDDAQLAEVAAEFNRRREDETPSTPQPVKFRPIPAAMEASQEDLIAKRHEDYAIVKRQRLAHECLVKLIQARGERYATCNLSNFKCDSESQEKAVETLRGYCEKVAENAEAGIGLFLFGPCGTGKDHLAMGVARAFIAATSQGVSWASGAMLFEQLRDSFDGKKSEGEVMAPHVKAPLLWISDPLPVRGDLTPYQAEALYRLVDARYNARKPIIVTANLEPGTADATLGPAIARRLRESTVRIHCNWLGYGRARNG